MGPLTETARFYAVFTGMSEETRLFQNMANDTADGIYVIGKDNYELYYVNAVSYTHLRQRALNTSVSRTLCWMTIILGMP